MELLGNISETNTFFRHELTEHEEMPTTKKVMQRMREDSKVSTQEHLVWKCIMNIFTLRHVWSSIS